MNTVIRRLTPLAALIGTIAGFPASAQDAHTWTFDYKKGETARFRTYMKIAGRMADASGDLVILMKSTSKHTVTDVSADGTTVYDQLDETSEAKINGKAIPPKAGEVKPVSITVDKSGLVLKRVNASGDPVSRPERAIIAIQSMPVPPMPVKAGESWKTEFPNPLMRGQKITATSTLVGVEKVLGIDAVKINLTADFPSTFGASENEIIHLQVSYHLDAKTHKLLRAYYVIKNPLLPLPGTNMEARVLVSSIVPGANDMADPEGEELLAPAKK